MPFRLQPPSTPFAASIHPVGSLHSPRLQPAFTLYPEYIAKVRK